MKPLPFLLCATLATGQALALESTSPIPANPPAERYEALIARSPFTLATPPAAPVAPPDKGFADGWYVTSLARVDGQDFVSIKARDGGVQFALFGTEPKDGISLQKVDWSTAVGRSTVTIAKDGQVAKLEFNQAELAAAPQAPAPVQNSQRTGPPGMTPPRPTVPRPVQPIVQPQGYGVPPPSIPNMSVPRPGVTSPQSGAGVIPGTGNVQTNDGRRRIRVIQNGN